MNTTKIERNSLMNEEQITETVKISVTDLNLFYGEKQASLLYIWILWKMK